MWCQAAIVRSMMLMLVQQKFHPGSNPHRWPREGSCAAVVSLGAAPQRAVEGTPGRCMEGSHRRHMVDESRQDGVAAKCSAYAGWRSICHGELNDWPTSRVAHPMRPLSKLVGTVISAQPRIGDLVFASRSGETPIVGYRKMWLNIAKLDDLPADITPHVLRRSDAGADATLKLTGRAQLPEVPHAEPGRASEAENCVRLCQSGR
jgi:hypothetical protein